MYLYGFICNGRKWGGGDTKNVIVGIVEERERETERDKERQRYMYKERD